MLGGQRDRTNEDGAATEELARLGVVDVGAELLREPDRGGYTFRCGASNRCRSRVNVVPSARETNEDSLRHLSQNFKKIAPSQTMTAFGHFLRLHLTSLFTKHSLKAPT